MTKLQEWLFQNQDQKYRDFQANLIPTVEKKRIIGVRTPILRKYVKAFTEKDRDIFFGELPHFYYEENNIHAFLIESIKEYERVIFELDRFLPYVDNWATCDSMRPKTLSLYPEKTLHKALEWVKSEKEYTVRYGIEVLMTYFLGSNYERELLGTIANIKREEYYIKMMCAWYFATAMIDHYDDVLAEFDNLDPWVRNKAITKACESYRIPDITKAHLKKLRTQEKENDRY